MNKIELDEELIIKLTKEGKRPVEISEITGVNVSYIRYRLNKLGIKPARKLLKLSNEILEKIASLHNNGKTNQQIANELQISPTTVRKYTTEFLHKKTNSVKAKSLCTKNIKLTELQLEVLYGSLLGDMSLGINGKHARPAITQGGKQEEYFDYKCSIFKNLIGKINKTPRYDKRTKKYYNRYVVRFLSNPLYDTIREELYPNGVKTITKAWLDKITTRGLAFWFMDDGCNSQTLATNCFSYDECQLIREWFFEKWGIKTTLHISHQNNKEQRIIYFLKEGWEIFRELIRPYLIPSMLYKIS